MDCIPTFDVQRARADTPGCESGLAHFNSAGAALPPASVTDVVVGHLRTEALRGGYEAAVEAEPRIAAVRSSIAALLNCGRDDVALLDNATRGWQSVFYALPLQPGDRILTCRAEYASNAIAFLQVARRTGATVEIVEDDESGQVDVEDLKRRMDGRVRLIAMTHIPTQGGLINPAESIGEIAAAADVPFLLDACQSVGQLDLDVARLHCDALSAPGRKFLRGPRGTGLLYVHPRLRDRLEPAMLDLHAARWTAPDRYEVRDSAQKFETWERDVAATIGLGAAVDYALSWGLAAIEERVCGLGQLLREELSAVPGVSVHDLGNRKGAIVSFTVESIPASAVQAELSAVGINTSISLREYAQFDLPHRGLPDLVRASVHYYNTEDEIARLVAAVGRIHLRVGCTPRAYEIACRA